MIDNADVTPNSRRAIWVEGELNEALLERLRPEILELTSQSGDPITVFLNSSGGNPEVQREILYLLRAPRKDGSRASVITVAAPKAASAAAHLLSAGDFAIASSDSKLLYHGGRWPLSDLVDAGEVGLLYARTLPTFREMAAAMLAGSSVGRFLFIVSAYRPLFAQHRADKDDPTLADLACFQAILREKLSLTAQTVLERAIPLWESYNGLLLQFQKRLPRGRKVTEAHLKKLMQYASFAFHHENDKGNPSWDTGFGRISDHFYFLNSYIDAGKVCDWVAARARPQTANTDVEADYFLQFRVFFLALCRALQEGENDITPFDALMLGLIDTIGAGAGGGPELLKKSLTSI